jgi:single-stranded-DNA-specific exonuclease
MENTIAILPFGSTSNKQGCVWMKWVKRKPVREPKENQSILEKLAEIRGIENMNDWLNPSEKFWLNPYGLDNIDEACERIVKAIHFKEKITIMADVDADGIFSCAIMFNYIKRIIDDMDKLTYIHAQRSSGHGLETVMEEEDNSKGVVLPIPPDTDLLIIVDSSSNSAEDCKKIKEDFGLDIVIIDHHEIDNENEHALIVNCQLGDYENKSLSGSAMTLKVCTVLDEYLGIDSADDFFDIACIGLISDMMNIDNQENRFIINKGLRQLKNEGLLALLHRNKVNTYGGLSVSDISFKVTPVVNACTRYDKIELALELFTADDEERLKELAKEMVKLNEKRKEEESEIVESAIKRVNDKHKVAVLIDNEIGSGFRGLIATQIANKLDKPTFVLKYIEETKEYHGSARSVGSIDLKNLVEITGDFMYAQGHSKAFGVGIKKEKLEEALTVLDELLSDEKDEEFVMYDLELNAKDINEDLIKEVERFNRITGMNCPKAIFLVTGLVAEERELLGKKKKETIKIQCDHSLALMKFKVNENYALDVEKALEDDDNFIVELEVVGELNLNEWYNFGKKMVIKQNQIFISDYRIVIE